MDTPASPSGKTILDDTIIQAANPYIKLSSSGSYYITDPIALQTCLSATDYDAVTKQIEAINLMLSSQDLDSNYVKIDTQSGKITIYGTSRNTARDYYEGVTKLEFVWFGVQIYLSKTDTQHLLNLGVAGAAATISVLFPGIGIAVASAVAAFVISEFGTSHMARAVIVDVGLQLPILGASLVGVRAIYYQYAHEPSIEV